MCNKIVKMKLRDQSALHVRADESSSNISCMGQHYMLQQCELFVVFNRIPLNLKKPL